MNFSKVRSSKYFLFKYVNFMCTHDALFQKSIVVSFRNERNCYKFHTRIGIKRSRVISLYVLTSSCSAESYKYNYIFKTRNFNRNDELLINLKRFAERAKRKSFDATDLIKIYRLATP